MDEQATEAQVGRQVRDLLRRAETAALATSLVRRGEAAPYASLALAACDPAGRPLLLLSDLADHSKNLAADPRLSLLFDGHGPEEEPLTGARVSLQGHAEVIEDPALLARFVARHPSAAGYAGFADFRLYRVEPTAAHLVAGFGRIHWVESAPPLLGPEAPALAEAEPGIVSHMNEDHGDALDLIAGRLLGLEGEDWRMVGVDPEGFDIRRGRGLARMAFDAPVEDAEDCRVELVRLTREARGRAG